MTHSVAGSTLATQYRVNTTGLSAEAIRDLQATAHKWQRRLYLSNAATAVIADGWAAGYRARRADEPRERMTSGSARAGWDYAAGESAYWHCIARDGYAAETA